MLCSKCNCELKVQQGKYISNKDSEEVYVEHQYKCDNKECVDGKTGRVVDIKNIKIN